jgi:uncharacterized protein YjbI with pentapeptide repeats
MVVAKLKSWAFLDLLQILGSFSLIVAAVSYCTGADDRARAQEDARKSRQYQAWQVITNAQGKPGNGGRVQALGELNADQVDLTGVDITGAYLPNLQLARATLTNGRGDSAVIVRADLRQATLSEGSFRKAQFAETDFRDVRAISMTLDSAKIMSSCLDLGTFDHSSFRGATFAELAIRHADFQWADFRGAVLFLVRFDSVNLAGSDFRGVNLRGTSFGDVMADGANFFGAVFRNATDSAMLQSRGAVWIEDERVWQGRRASTNPKIASEWEAVRTASLSSVRDASPFTQCTRRIFRQAPF